jgi:hypothetical protein
MQRVFTDLTLDGSKDAARVGVMIIQFTFRFMIAPSRSLSRASSDGIQTHPPAMIVINISTCVASKL